MSSLAELKQALTDNNELLAIWEGVLEEARDDAESLQGKADTLAEIRRIEGQIASLSKANPSPAPPPPPLGEDVPPPPPADGDAAEPPKYDMSKHPKFRKASPEAQPTAPEETRAVFNVKDTVMARFSEDGQWYPATIITKTGSPADPVYTVTFKGYGNTETKRKQQVRAMESKKRKAEGPPAVSTPQPPGSPKSVSNGTVISAAPSVDPTLVQKREPSKVSDGPTRMAPEPKKLKGVRALEKGKSSWNAWQQSGPKKIQTSAPKKKDSQFRTPDLPNAKVGFTGSGKPMQKDQAKAKWVYGGGSGD